MKMHLYYRKSLPKIRLIFCQVNCRLFIYKLAQFQLIYDSHKKVSFYSMLKKTEKVFIFTGTFQLFLRYFGAFQKLIH